MLQLPDYLIIDLLSNWLSFLDYGVLDSAWCNHKHRQQILDRIVLALRSEQISLPHSSSKLGLSSRTLSIVMWIASRRLVFDHLAIDLTLLTSEGVSFACPYVQKLTVSEGTIKLLTWEKVFALFPCVEELHLMYLAEKSLQRLIQLGQLDCSHQHP